jgi:hypothetical protein
MRLYLSALALALSALQTAAQARDPGLSSLHAIAIMNGTCKQLTIADKDASSGCEGKLTNTIYKTGRSGFTFLVGDLAVVTFSGADSAAKGNSATIHLDKVIFTLIGTGTDPNVIRATGTCTYTNPYVGPSHVTCSASTKSGRFSAAFVSNGQPPDLQEF